MSTQLLAEEKSPQNQKHPEHVRAALLYKMSGFVRWPEGYFDSKRTPIGVCAFGEDQKNKMEYLKMLTEKKMRNRGFVVTHYKTWTDIPVPKLRQCSVSYFLEMTKKQRSSLNNTLKIVPTLKIADSIASVMDNGLVGFIEDDGRMQMYVNFSEYQGSRVKLSSSLLKHVKLLNK